MESNEQPEEDEECSICLDSLPKDASKFMRARCCGKGMHFKCRDGVLVSSMSHKQKNHCVMCRTKYPNGSKEEIEQLRPWVVKEKAWAQSMLGQNYAHGEGVEQSYQRAKELWELAANQGDAAAQNNLGILYANGHGVEQSFEAARAWWMKSAEQGNEQAITGLQQLDEFEGRTTPSFTPPKRCSLCDTPETPTHKINDCPCFGAQYCNAKCQTSQWKLHKKEHRRLCKELKLTNTEGEMKDEVVEEVEEVVEVEEVEEVEEEGETKEVASSPLSQQQEEEDVCPVCIDPLQKDPTKFLRYACCGKGIHIWCDEAIKVSSLSHEQKNSCPLCRTKYLVNGSEEAVDQLRPWVEKRKAWAQCMLGGMYGDGEGVEQSYQRAKELYEMSASQGHAMAQYTLGNMYYKGQGVDQNYEKAVEYYEAAARQGYAAAQFNLGALYANGQGVEQSNETAREWWMKSAEQGNENAIKALQGFDEVEGRTTPSFIPKPFECASCYRPHDPSEHKLRPCNGCHRVYYCGKECQTKHWKDKYNGHKKMCNKKAK